MGGSFGLRSTVFPEMPLVLLAARQIGRPVKWVNDRSDGILDEQGRDFVMTGELALDAEGMFLGFGWTSPRRWAPSFPTTARIPLSAISAALPGSIRRRRCMPRVTGVVPNTSPTGPVRGAGRPEATSLIEQAIDKAAREMGLDRDRAPPAQHHSAHCHALSGRRSPTTTTVASSSATWTRRGDDRCGRLRGTPRAGGGGGAATRPRPHQHDRAGGGRRRRRRRDPLRSPGQRHRPDGHPFARPGPRNRVQTAGLDRLGLEFEAIRYVQGDTDVDAYGHGTGGSRVSGLGGSALLGAVEKVVEKGRHIAAHALETSEADIEFADGRFVVAGTDRSLDIREVARIAFDPAALPPETDSGLSSFSTFRVIAPTFPNACHAAEVEIDPETGSVRIERYLAVEDVGTVLNPMLLDGQLHGGIVQGAGHVFGEEMRWDGDGQVLTGSFMDYVMPRADEMPFFEIAINGVPTARNPLGVKGAGEAGTVGAVACLTAAVLDALSPLGIEDLPMPLTPERLWRVIREAVD